MQEVVFISSQYNTSFKIYTVSCWKKSWELITRLSITKYTTLTNPVQQQNKRIHSCRLVCFRLRKYTSMGSFFPFIVMGPLYWKSNWSSWLSSWHKHLKQLNIYVYVAIKVPKHNLFYNWCAFLAPHTNKRNGPRISDRNFVWILEGKPTVVFCN